MKLCIALEVIKGQFYIEISDLYYFFLIRPSYLITTMTYILMNNFCPCFKGKIAELMEENRGKGPRDLDS